MRELAPQVMLEVDAQDPLAAVEERVGAGHETGDRIAGQRLDLDDLGAEVGQQPRAVGAGKVEAEVEHPDPAQRRRGHATTPRSRSAVIRSGAIPSSRRTSSPSRPGAPGSGSGGQRSAENETGGATTSIASELDVSAHPGGAVGPVARHRLGQCRNPPDGDPGR